MSWDDPFYRDSYCEPDDAHVQNPYAAMSGAKMRNTGAPQYASMPEGGLRYEQQGVPASVAPPGCPCGSCPWRAQVERGRAAIAMPTQSLDARSDAAMGALLARVLGGAVAAGAGAVANTENMTVPKATREVTIVAQTLSMENFLIIFLFIIVVYLCITFTRQLAALRKKLGVEEE